MANESCACVDEVKRHSQTYQVLQVNVGTHLGKKLHGCQVCHRAFKQPCLLRKHMRIHTGEKPHRCQFCERSFAQSSALKNHVKTHTGEKPYKCKLCQRTFAQSGHLTTHMKTHTGEKPYICLLCEKSFATIYDLKTHQKIHTGEKPYRCEVCQKAFKHIGSLKRHRRTRMCKKAHIYDKFIKDSRSLNKPLKCLSRVQPIFNLEDEIRKMDRDCNELTERKRRQNKRIGISECLFTNKLKPFEDIIPFLANSYGCGICDEVFAEEKEFLEHCSGHGATPPDDLFLGLF